MSKANIPGVVRPVAKYRPWQKQANGKRTIDQKREVIIRTIERRIYRWRDRAGGDVAARDADADDVRLVANA